MGGIVGVGKSGRYFERKKLKGRRNDEVSNLRRDGIGVVSPFLFREVCINRPCWLVWRIVLDCIR